MIVFFIEESNKFKFFKKIEVKEDKIYINKKIDKINKNIVHNILKILKNNNCRNVVISKNLKKSQLLLNCMYSNNINIIQGKMLSKIMVEDLITNICDKNKINLKDCKIAFSLNYAENYILNAIENLSKKFKTISIVTNNIQQFEQFKGKLYNEYGVILTLSNNKKKALLRSNIIVNVDFPDEVLNKYYIYDNAIIINLEEYVNIHKKRFSGKIINDYNILLKENSNIAIELQKVEYKKYDLKDLAELFVIKYPREAENIVVDKLFI